MMCENGALEAGALCIDRRMTYASMHQAPMPVGPIGPGVSGGSARGYSKSTVV